MFKPSSNLTDRVFHKENSVDAAVQDSVLGTASTKGQQTVICTFPNLGHRLEGQEGCWIPTKQQNKFFQSAKNEAFATLESAAQQDSD